MAGSGSRAEKLLAHPLALINQVRRVALDAGARTMVYFDDMGGMSGGACVETKADKSPVTVADREAEEIIARGLADILPDVPMIGEESVAQGHIPEIAGHALFWLVDPLDGTRAFIAGSPEFTVNIALIRDGSPFLGVVYAPAFGRLYAGYGAGTAIRWLEETGAEKSIHVRTPPKSGLTVLASYGHGYHSRMEAFLKDYKIRQIIRQNSSLKICAIASGKGDMYPRFGTTCEWDTAAGHAVLLSAGGNITDFSGRPLCYGASDSRFLNPEFVAWSEDLLTLHAHLVQSEEPA